MNASDREREILTTEQAAEVLQVSKDLIYRYIRDGLLLASRIGRGYRIPCVQIERLLWDSRVRQDIVLRAYSDAQLAEFLREDTLTPEEAAIVKRFEGKEKPDPQG